MSWILLRSGAAYDYGSDTCADMAYVDDVVVPLSRIARGYGHTSEPWSVAAHALLVARLARRAGEPREVVLDCLHHDDSEALVGDVVKPLKDLLGDAYRALEDRAALAVMHAAHADGLAHYRLPDPVDYKTYDLIALGGERLAVKAQVPFGRVWYTHLKEMWDAEVEWARHYVNATVAAGAHHGPVAARAYLRTMTQLSGEGGHE